MNINPILLDIPHQFESRRLILRTPLDGDGSIIYPAVQETQDLLHRWSSTVFIAESVADAEENIRGARADLLLRQAIRLLIFHQTSGEFVGEAQFYDFDWSVPRCQLGYWARASMQKQGFMTEAVQRMTDIGFDILNLERIDISFDAENQANYRVAEKAGYKLEGRLRNHRRRRDGQLTDTVLFGMISSDWEHLQADDDDESS